MKRHTFVYRCLTVLTSTIGVRIKREDRELLEQVCNARGEDLSDFIRRSIRKELASLSFYTEEIKKALGVIKQ
jgi:hypothetical protein